MLSQQDFTAKAHDALNRTMPTRKKTTPLAFSETFADFGLDSLDTMNLFLELEQGLGISLGELDFKEYNSLEKLYPVYQKAQA